MRPHVATEYLAGGRQVASGVNLAYAPAAVSVGMHRYSALAEEKERWWDSDE